MDFNNFTMPNVDTSVADNQVFGGVNKIVLYVIAAVGLWWWIDSNKSK
jgi:hypothetical protein